MNLKAMFETQRKLRKRIVEEHNLNVLSEEFNNNLILALYVEVGECANEWRGFKQWSKDKEPRTYHKSSKNPSRDGIRNPLLEEYVDGLHFVLEQGLQWCFDQTYKPSMVIVHDTGRMFREVYKCISDLAIPGGRNWKKFHYEDLFNNYLALGKSLGFTWEQIENAYYEKNKVNFQRQEDGY